MGLRSEGCIYRCCDHTAPSTRIWHMSLLADFEYRSFFYRCHFDIFVFSVNIGVAVGNVVILRTLL